MKKENWIKWDLDSRSGLKMASFFADHGAAGYGFFIVLIEMLYRAEDNKLPRDAIAMQKYAKLCKCTTEHANKFLHDLHAEGLFKIDANSFWSPRVMVELTGREEKRKDISTKRKDAAISRWEKHTKKSADANACKPMQTHAKPIDQRRGEEIRDLDPPLSPLRGKRLQPKITDIDFPPSLDTPDARAALGEWLDYKTARNQKYKSGASVRALLKQWERSGSAGFVEAIQFSMGNNYSGIFAGKNGNGNGTHAKQSTAASNIDVLKSFFPTKPENEEAIEI